MPTKEPTVPLAAEGLSRHEIRRAIKQLKSGNHTMGREVRVFEEHFSNYHGVKHAVMVNSGSSANLLALEALCRSSKNARPKPGARIAVPAILWPTTFWPIIQLGFIPLIIDTEPNSLRIDFHELFRAKEEFGDDLIGAILIHPLGRSLDSNEICRLSESGMFVIEDTCESLGAVHMGKRAGTNGVISTFSFYYSHHITTIEGGMVLTNSDDIADDLRSMRAHGWTRNRADKAYWDEMFSGDHEDFRFVTSGYNFRPTEIQGVLGQSQLEQLEKFVLMRINFAEELNESLKNKNSLELIDYVPKMGESQIHSWMAFPLQIIDKNLNLLDVMKKLELRGIATRPLLAGNFVSQPAVTREKIEIFGSCRNSIDLYKRSFMVGNHHSFTERQKHHLIRTLSQI